MDKTTIVMMGYNIDRINKNKEIIFKEYGNNDQYIDKIIFIWNNKDKQIPQINNYNVPIIKVIANKNSLCNRHHIVREHIDTESVIIVDEDIVLDKQSIIDLMKTWKHNKDHVIGLQGRSYDKNGNYSFEIVEGDTIITIGQTMMYHKKYMDEFSKYTDLHNMVDNKDEAWHCDDLVFQLLVNHINNKPMTIISNTTGRVKQLDDTGGVSNVDNWKDIRSMAIKNTLHYLDNERLNENRVSIFITILIFIIVLILLIPYIL